jgi:hypothetical protein
LKKFDAEVALGQSLKVQPSAPVRAAHPVTLRASQIDRTTTASGRRGALARRSLRRSPTGHAAPRLLRGNEALDMIVAAGEADTEMADGLLQPERQRRELAVLLPQRDDALAHPVA